MRHPVEQVSPDDYDAVVLPGGVANPDNLRTVPAAVKFLQSWWRRASRSR